MRPLGFSLALLRRLWRNERGNFAMMFGLMAIPLMGFIGLATDVTRAYMARVQLQGACDTAALAAATLHGQDDATVKAMATKYFYSNYSKDYWAPPLVDPVVTINGQVVTVSATATQTNFFVRLFGYNTFDIAAAATAMSQGTGLEVAMVLDITSSMDSGDMTNLKNASTTLVNILFGSQTTSPLLNIGVVPFTTSVRVDPTTFVNNNWVDKTGASSIARLNFDTSGGAGNNFAYALYKTPNGLGYTQTPWVGCLDVRPSGLDETDTPPTSGDTLFVPFFAPDSPDSIPAVAVASTANIAALSGKPTIDGVAVTNSMRILVKNQTTTKNNGIYVTPASGSGAWTRATDANTVVQLTRATVTVTQGNTNKNTQWVETAIVTTIGTSAVTFASNNGSFQNNYLTDVTASVGTVARQTYTKKYQAKSLSTSGGAFVTGPDRNCVNTAIQPLTNNKTNLVNMISGLQADGYTNIPIGIGWGWRVLSQAAPYTEGHADDDANWQKILIIETDGCNTMPSTADCTTSTPDDNPWGSDYGGYAFGFQERLGAGVNDTVKMMAAENTSMAKVCANIKAVKKADGTPVYTIYTIGFGTEIKQGNNEAILKGCATINNIKGSANYGQPNYYFTPKTADLSATFSEIATDLTKIRLTK